jgi:hypothetical protein
MAAVIETIELKKNYGNHEAVRSLNLSVQAGSVCGHRAKALFSVIASTTSEKACWSGKGWPLLLRTSGCMTT